MTLICDVMLSVWLPGCEYGDRDVTYCSQILRRDCYDASIQQTCCARCAAERNVNASANCQFGDKANWCNPADFKPSDCYSSANATCCEMCAGYRTGPPGDVHHLHDVMYSIESITNTRAHRPCTQMEILCLACCQKGILHETCLSLLTNKQLLDKFRLEVRTRGQTDYNSR